MAINSWYVNFLSAGLIKSTRFFIDSTNFLQTLFISSLWNHVCMTYWTSIIFIVQSCFLRRFFTIDHKFSIPWRSGHSRTSIFIFLKYCFITLALWHSAESCWKMAWGWRLAISLETLFYCWQIDFADYDPLNRLGSNCAGALVPIEGIVNSKTYLPILKRRVFRELANLHPQAIFQHDSAQYH